VRAAQRFLPRCGLMGQATVHGIEKSYARVEVG